MAYNLNTLLSNNDSGGTWTQTSGPFTFTLDSNTGIISNLTIVNGEVTVPTCLSAGTYTFNYSIETCVGSNTFVSEDVSIEVDNTVNSIANLPTYYICREEGGVGIIKDPNDNVLSTMTIDSPLYLGTCDNSTLTDPVEVFIGSSTTVIVDTTPLTPIQLTWADFNNAFNAAQLDPLHLQVCRTYNLESQSSCSEPAEGIIYETPELKSFTNTFSDCVEDQPYTIGTFLPDAFYNYINDVFPNPGLLGGSLRSPNSLGLGTGPCSRGSINIQYSEDQVTWTDFNPFNVNDPNTITPTFDGNGDWNSTLYYRIEFIFPGGIVVCYKESTVTIMSEACCDCTPTLVKDGCDLILDATGGGCNNYFSYSLYRSDTNCSIDQADFTGISSSDFQNGVPALFPITIPIEENGFYTMTISSLTCVPSDVLSNCIEVTDCCAPCTYELLETSLNVSNPTIIDNFGQSYFIRFDHSVEVLETCGSNANVINTITEQALNSTPIRLNVENNLVDFNNEIISMDVINQGVTQTINIPAGQGQGTALKDYLNSLNLGATFFKTGSGLVFMNSGSNNTGGIDVLGSFTTEDNIVHSYEIEPLASGSSSTTLSYQTPCLNFIFIETTYDTVNNTYPSYVEFLNNNITVLNQGGAFQVDYNSINIIGSPTFNITNASTNSTSNITTCPCN